MNVIYRCNDTTHEHSNNTEFSMWLESRDFYLIRSEYVFQFTCLEMIRSTHLYHVIFELNISKQVKKNSFNDLLFFLLFYYVALVVIVVVIMAWLHIYFIYICVCLCVYYFNFFSVNLCLIAQCDLKCVLRFSVKRTEYHRGIREFLFYACTFDLSEWVLFLFRF